MKGSAHASGAVFRALSEDLRGVGKCGTFGPVASATLLDARRVQRHPRAGVLPHFGFRVQGVRALDYFADCVASGLQRTRPCWLWPAHFKKWPGSARALACCLRRLAAIWHRLHSTRWQASRRPTCRRGADGNTRLRRRSGFVVAKARRRVCSPRGANYSGQEDSTATDHAALGRPRSGSLPPFFRR